MLKDTCTLIALFIDGDNIAPHNIGTVIDIVKTRGKILMKRIYGDFSQENMKNWYKYSLEYSLDPIQVWRIQGKQSTDIKITADCVELMMQKNNIEYYVLVTGDGDFITLVNKLKTRGKFVLGISQYVKSTSSYLPNSCDEFIMLDSYLKSKEWTENNESETHIEKSSEEFIIEKLRIDLIDTIKSILEDYDQKGIILSKLKDKLLELNPKFSEINFGFPKFGRLISSFHCFDIVKVKTILYVKCNNKDIS